MPMPPWSDSLLKELERIRYKRNLVPIMAHIDRYVSPLRTKGIPEIFAELPVLVQASGSFFANWKTRNLALRLLQDKKIHLLGSDCHNLDARMPNLQDAVRIIEEKMSTSSILRINSLESRLLDGENTKERIYV
jgi:protein-tyrosine phosphatase